MQDGSPASPELSILVPVYNEVESLTQLHREISEGCRGAVDDYEIVFVDDGSSDGSADALDALADSDPRVSVIHLRRNFGKSPALAAGFEHVRGEIVITMDADLQDDPAMIPEFVKRIRAGADMVSGWKQKRHDPTRQDAALARVQRRGAQAERRAAARLQLRLQGLPRRVHARAARVRRLPPLLAGVRPGPRLQGGRAGGAPPCAPAWPQQVRHRAACSRACSICPPCFC